MDIVPEHILIDGGALCGVAGFAARSSRPKRFSIMSLKDLAGGTAFVMDAASGIGLGIATALAKASAFLAFNLLLVWVFIGAIVEPTAAVAQTDEASRLIRLAFPLYSQGRYAEAEQLLKRALAIREKALGPDHAHVAASTPPTDCDSYAGNLTGPQEKGALVPFDQINSTLAIPACEGAVREDINNGRLHFALGRAYEKAKDLDAAVAQYLKGADLGNANAQDMLGWMYANGHGVPQDYQQAIAWYRRAADRGDANAQFSVGLMYDTAKGVAQNYEEAASWYRKAAEQGNADAQNSLGSLYAKGEGVPQDIKQAVAWYQKAADQGLAAAEYNLGFRYHIASQGIPEFLIPGISRSKALVLAYMWLSASATQGEQEAIAVKTMVETRLGPAKSAELRRLADQEWKQLHEKK
jgi:TPR repeat protein